MNAVQLLYIDNDARWTTNPAPPPALLGSIASHDGRVEVKYPGCAEYPSCAAALAGECKQKLQ